MKNSLTKSFVTIGTLFIGLATFGFLILTLLYSTFAWGFILFKFWKWFAIPVFTSLPMFSYLQACGLIFLTDIFRRNSQLITDKYLQDNNNFINIINPWVTLLFGYLFYIIFIL